MNSPPCGLDCEVVGSMLAYALSRGLTIDQIDRFRIGSPTLEIAERYNIRIFGSWMSSPTFHDGELMGIKLRNITNRGLRYMGIAGSRKGLFNYDAVNLKDCPVLVFKGEIAVMVADRFGLLACASTGGEESYVKEVRHALIFSRNIVIGDNDPGEGQERARELQEWLDSKAIGLSLQATLKQHFYYKFSEQELYPQLWGFAR